MRQLWMAWCVYLVMFSSFAFAEVAVFSSKVGEPFEDYQQRAELFLRAHKEWINADNKAEELAAVMPFELLPDPKACAGSARIGVLLSHGLSDSPFLMRDSAEALQANCYRVRVILLPGHGTRSADLLEVDESDWRRAFKTAADQFQTQVDYLYVGGFSTGGTLAVEYAWHNSDQVSGVLLFSPLFKMKSRVDWLLPLLSSVKDWWDNDPTDDYAKYASIPLTAMGSAYRLAKDTRYLLSQDPKNMPVFMALSKEDQTADSNVSESLFYRAMVAPNSQMIVYSAKQGDSRTDRVKVYNTNWTDRRIVGLSHMAIQGSPNNTYYGEIGSYRMCGWYRSNLSLLDACREDSDNWFGAKSQALMLKSPHAARISWNPNFDALMVEATNFIRASSGRR